MSPTLTCQQVEFVRGNESMMAWVDVKWDLKPEDQVTGKDGATWTVKAVYDAKVEYHHLNKKWEVGGLGGE